jgi:3',5'-cyclic AMP phosphodiesterase CpdA
MARIVVLSDIHLSPTHGFFWENWCVAREFADAAKADAVIVNGDLAIIPRTRENQTRRIHGLETRLPPSFRSGTST